MATVGFVGLGIMGRPMLRNLIKAGHTVVAFGRTPAKLDAAVADGAQRCSSNADVGARAEIVITMLPDGPEVEEVVLGPDGILSGSKPGSLIIDMSSISPLVSQKNRRGLRAERRRFPRRSRQWRRAQSRRRHTRHHGRRQA